MSLQQPLQHLKKALCAGELPIPLLVKIFQHLLQPQLLHNSWTQPFHQDSPVLRTAITLSATCHLWRQAAAEAVQMQRLLLEPHPRLARQSLSPLLASLVVDCPSIKLHIPLLAAPSVQRFLQLANPAVLHLYGAPMDTNVGPVQATCTWIRGLRCEDGLLPSAWPTNLQELTAGLLERESPPGAGQALLDSLQGLPSLAKLHLRQSGRAAREHTGQVSFQGFSALRELTVDLSFIPQGSCFGLSLLSAAAARDISLTLVASGMARYLQAISALQCAFAALPHQPHLAGLHLSCAGPAKYGEPRVSPDSASWPASTAGTWC